MDNNVITGFIVTGGLIIQQAIKAYDKRQDLENKKLDEIAAERRHNWEDQERKRVEKNVLTAVAENTGLVKEGTVAAAKSYDAANNVNQKMIAMDEKMAVIIPNSAEILSDMLKVGGSVAPADIARVLIEMKRSADVMELYTRAWSHRFRNIFQVFLAHFEIDDPNGEMAVALRQNLEDPAFRPQPVTKKDK